MNTSKTQHLKPFRMNTYEKTPGGREASVAQASACALSLPPKIITLGPESPARRGGPLLPYSLLTTHYSLLSNMILP
jgi:hypothetical protein